ncbi:hypothetical protein WJX77_002172 [Trebouxia sp. C0004]
MNSFFLTKLSEKLTERHFNGQPAHEPLMQTHHGLVKGHTKGIGIFSKEFILIPAHKGLHWTLIVVCYPSPAYKGQHRGVLHLDSLLGLRRGSLQEVTPEQGTKSHAECVPDKICCT